MIQPDDDSLPDAELADGGTMVATNGGGTALAAGDSFQLFNAGSYGGNFAAVTLPALGSGLVWNTNSLNSAGEISVVGVVPHFDAVTASGTNLVLQGGGGLPNGRYYLLGATNVALPLASWARLATNHYDATGNFNCTNLITPNMPQQFFRILLP